MANGFDPFLYDRPVLMGQACVGSAHAYIHPSTSCRPSAHPQTRRRVRLDRRQQYAAGRDSVFDPFVDASCNPDRAEWRCGYKCSESDIAAFKWCCGSNTYVPVIGILGFVLATCLARRAFPPACAVFW